MKKSINILGVTGSIGQAACDVICANPELFDVHLITAHTDSDGLQKCADRLNANHAILTSVPPPSSLHSDTSPRGGEDDRSDSDDLVGGALKEALSIPVDITVCAITGMAGLPSMIQAIKHSKAVAIANKEPLVAAGRLVIEHAKKHGTTLLPLDSEHNAIFQCFDPAQKNAIEKITITASGGPFRTWTKEGIYDAPIEKALKHPNWSMGQKITIDSATLANKALEVIEAVRLFDLDYKKIEVVVHPQSIIHSLVTYKDGSSLAQLGNNDMRVPISHALGFPNRIKSSVQPLNFKRLNDLTFEPVDHDKFPFVNLAYEVLKVGDYACLTMNAANEVAVESYLKGQIKFGQIYEVVKETLDQTPSQDLYSLDDILEMDKAVRERTQTIIQSLT